MACRPRLEEERQRVQGALRSLGFGLCALPRSVAARLHLGGALFQIELLGHSNVRVVETLRDHICAVATLEENVRVGVSQSVWVKLGARQATAFAEILEAASDIAHSDVAGCRSAREHVGATVCWAPADEPGEQEASNFGA